MCGDPGSTRLPARTTQHTNAGSTHRAPSAARRRGRTACGSQPSFPADVPLRRFVGLTPADVKKKGGKFTVFATPTVVFNDSAATEIYTKSGKKRPPPT